MLVVSYDGKVPQRVRSVLKKKTMTLKKLSKSHLLVCGHVEVN